MTVDIVNYASRYVVVLGQVGRPGLVPIDLPDIASLLHDATAPDGQLKLERIGRAGPQSLFPLWILKYLPNMIAAHISMATNAQGPNNTIVTACAAGTQAVGEAFRLIARGDVDAMLEQIARPGWEERSHLAEILRLKGWMLSLKGDLDGAERNFLASLDWARRQQAKSWELRTSTSLAAILFT
jgi:hypothetical protein